MDYFYDNVSFSPSTFAGDFDIYPLVWNPMLANEGTNIQPLDTTANHRGTERSGHTIDLPTDFTFSNNYEPAASVTPYFTQINGHPKPPYPYPDQRLPDVQVQLQLADFSGSDAPLVNAALEAPVPVPSPSDMQLINWCENQGGSTTSTFRLQNVHPSRQSRTGSTRTETAGTRQSTRYGQFRVRGTKHTNAEAGPSTLIPSHNRSVSLPMRQTSGGIPKTAAHAVNHQQDIEEDGVPKSKVRGSRIRAQSNSSILRQWAQRRKGVSSLPSINEALAAAAEIIRTIREMVSQEPRLRRTRTKETEASEKAMIERARRTVERELFQELSLYYPRENSLWSGPQLLSKVIQDLKDHSYF